MMHRLYVFLFCLMACTPSGTPDLSELSRQEILAADREMSTLAVSSGFHTALIAFADDSLIKPDEGKLPVMGKKALEAQWSGNPGSKGISWEPIRAEAAKSGELGYTFGNWKFVAPDTTYYGNYFTTWRKQDNGTWKWTMDGGNNTPAPE